MKILVIDDNQGNLTALKAMLSDRFPEVRLLTALSGLQCVELALAEDPDVILLDILTPGMDGCAVCRKIKAEERLRSIPVIFMTSLQSDRESRVKAMEAGAEGFLSKPFDDLELSTQIRTMAKIKAANRKQQQEKEELATLVTEHTQALEQEMELHKQAEEVLARTAREWQTIIDATNDVIWLLDKEQRVVLSNKATERIFQRPAEACIGMYCWEIVHGTKGPIPECPVLRASQSLRRESTELQIGKGWFEVTCDPIVHAAGQYGGAVHIVSDITERKQAEEALRESDIFARSTLDGLSAHIAIVDESGVIVAVNRSWREFADGNPPVLGNVCEGANYLDICDSATSDAPEAAKFAEAIRAILNGSAEKFEMEYDCHSPDEQRWFIGHLTRFPDSTRPRVVVAHQDITARKLAEEALRASERQHRLLVQHLHAGVVVHAPDTHIILANEQASRLLGLSIDQMMGKTAIDPAWRFVQEDETVMPLEEYPVQRVLATRQPIRDLVVGVDRPTTEDRVWVLVNAFSELDTHERLRQAVVTFVDITERRLAEEKLAHSRRQLELILNSAAEGILGLDLQGNHTFVNPAAATMLGYTVEEFIGRPSHSLWHHTTLEGNPCPEEECQILNGYRNGQVHRVKTEVFWRKDGTSFPVDYASTPIIEQGRVLGAVVTFVDISEQKRAAKSLRESERRFMDVLYSSVDAILLIGDNTIVDCNEATARMLGYATRKDILQTHLSALSPSEQPNGCSSFDKADEMMKMALEHGFHRFEWIYRRANGEDFPVEVSLTPIVHEGKSLLYCVWRDITAHKLAEEERDSFQVQLTQAQKMESVGRLAGGIAHDFNNMLSVILGYGEILLDKLHPADPLQDNVKEIVKAGRRSAALTRQLLAFSRKQTLHPEVLDLNTVIRNTEKMLCRLIGEDIDLELALSDKIDLVMADPGQIEQVIMNLSVNARDAMPRGGKLILETANVAIDETYAKGHVSVHPGNYVMLAVTDDGCGMDNETLTKIFEPFFTTKEMGKGTGLGLATVYGIVKQSGGNIWAYSEPGRGTTFKIYLPQTLAGQEPKTGSVGKENPKGGGEHILVVEDEDSLRKLTETVLSILGYKVSVAANGGEALLLMEMKGLKPDLVITDVVMPYMSGKDLVNRLQRNQPDLKVLYMSGYTDNAIVHLGVLDEGVHFIQKPFLTQALAAKVREAMGRE